MKCPKCNESSVDGLYDETDIDDDYQPRLSAIECSNCGIIGVCPHCGAWDFEPCRAWCGDAENYLTKQV